MASVSHLANESDGPFPGPGPVRYRPAGDEQRGEALALLLTGRVHGGEAAVRAFLQFSQEHRLSLEGLWLAQDQRGRPLASALVVPSAGKAAMIFFSPAASWPSDGVAAELIRRACADQQIGDIRLVQAMLEPELSHPAQVLTQAGFEELALLSYMQRRGTTPWTPLDLGDRAIDVRHWNETNRPLFERCILASYEQTLDCRGLLGLRDVGDVVAGHMAAGVFDPTLWYALQADDQPVGVMLLNDVPQSSALELVYLGLALPWRGRGLAGRLLRHGLAQVRQRRRTRMILAVDEANAPAMQLYRREGFHVTSRKRAMIRK